MPLPKKSIKNFDKETIKILRPVPLEQSRGNELAIIRWISDGHGYAPQLVSQEIYTDRKTNERKYGKIKGLKWGDFKFLTENPERVHEISELLLDRVPGSYDKTTTGRGQEAAANDQPEKDPFMD